MSVFSGKNIILGVCGGIAAYKSAELLRLLIKQGAQVQVVMTPSAQKFVGAMTMQSLSGQPVRSDLFDEQAEAGMGHIELARWADLVLIVPATANTLAKITQGIADNLLTTICLASKAPIVLAPAMNQQMWLSEENQANVRVLQARSRVLMAGPAEGEQACGDTGPGRMEEPEAIISFVAQKLEQQVDIIGLFKGKTVMITAGPTIEAIDPVRYITNRSSGKMGYAIAQAAVEAGAEVILVSGPVSLPEPEGVKRYRVQSALQMHQSVFEHLKHTDIFIATAAVADYRPVEIKAQKIKKSQEKITLELIKNPDILADVAAQAHRPFTVGFAAETDDLETYALDKLQRKNLDMIAANFVGSDQNGQIKGFEADTNALTLFIKTPENKIESKSLPETTKQELARELIKEIALRFLKRKRN